RNTTMARQDVRYVAERFTRGRAFILCALAVAVAGPASCRRGGLSEARPEAGAPAVDAPADVGPDLSIATGDAGDDAPGSCSGNADPGCSLARTGDACTQDCQLACGPGGLGTKTCVCAWPDCTFHCSCPRPGFY